MQDDILMHFTDDIYADVDDIRKELGIHNVDSIMQKQLKYRANYIGRLDLKNYEDKNFCFCLSPGVLYRLSSFECKLNKNVYIFNSFPRDIQAQLIKESTLRIGNTYAIFNNLKVSDDYLLYLLNDNDIPQEFKILRNYLLSIKDNLYHDEKFDENTLKSIFKKLITSSNLNTDFVVPYREEKLVVHKDSYVENVEVSKIPLYIEDLFNFINTPHLFNTLKTIVTYFYINYIKPFDLVNEEVAIISLKYLLGNLDASLLTMILPLEDVLLQNHKLETTFVKSLVSRDLTYYILDVLTILENKLDEFASRFAKYITPVEKMSTADIVAQREITFNDNINSVNHDKINIEEKFTTAKKVSLPVLPVGLNDEEADLIASNLQELYPSLKPLQCVFYAHHCTLGKYYSIAQYKKEMGVVYETARTSMDNLTNVGLYKKEFVGNKFVYTPVNKGE